MPHLVYLPLQDLRIIHSRNKSSMELDSGNSRWNINSSQDQRQNQRMFWILFNNSSIMLIQNSKTRTILFTSIHPNLILPIIMDQRKTRQFIGICLVY